MILPSGMTVNLAWKGDVIKDSQLDVHFTDGGIFSGAHKNLQRDGQGSMTYGNGHKYSGLWMADGRHGYGVLHF